MRYSDNLQDFERKAAVKAFQLLNIDWRNIPFNAIDFDVHYEMINPQSNFFATLEHLRVLEEKTQLEIQSIYMQGLEQQLNFKLSELTYLLTYLNQRTAALVKDYYDFFPFN